MPNQRWEDLSATRTTAVVLTGTVQMALLVAALVDIYRRPAEEIRGRKLLWTAAAFINFVGPLAYFLFGRRR